MVQYKLNYFNARGRAEAIRFLLVEADQKYIDNRIESADWPAWKPLAPFGQNPYLEIHENDGNITNLAQSISILRYLARRLGFAGDSTELQQAITEMYADQISDLLNEIAKARFEAKPERKEEFTAKLNSEILPLHLAFFEKRLAENKGYLSGNNLTYADLHLFASLEWLGEEKLKAVEQEYPNIGALDKNIRERPRIKAYLATRPKTEI